VLIERLELDGALVIECPEGESLTVKDKVVKNEGWKREPSASNDPEYIKMRGYKLVKKETTVLKPSGGKC